jgi:hypothetical protein
MRRRIEKVTPVTPDALQLSNGISTESEPSFLGNEKLTMSLNPIPNLTPVRNEPVNEEGLDNVWIAVSRQLEELSKLIESLVLSWLLHLLN